MGNEKGFVLVVCLMILVVLTFLGMAALNNTTTELMISGNDNIAKSAFYRADSGIYTVPKVLRETVSSRAQPAAPLLKFLDPTNETADADFVDKILGYKVNPTRIDFSLGAQPVEVEIASLGSYENPGGSTEFGMSYDGAAKQSYHLLYRLSSEGQAPGNALAQIEARYKLMPGTAGGL